MAQTVVVKLHVAIKKDGTVEDIEFVDGNSRFRHEALQAVKAWKYKPVVVQGARVEIKANIDLAFSCPWSSGQARAAETRFGSIMQRTFLRPINHTEINVLSKVTLVLLLAGFASAQENTQENAGIKRRERGKQSGSFQLSISADKQKYSVGKLSMLQLRSGMSPMSQ